MAVEGDNSVNNESTGQPDTSVIRVVDESSHTKPQIESSDPREWGPPLWKVIHTMAANYPRYPTAQDKGAARQFFYSLQFLLPCKVCRAHFSTLITSSPPTVDSYSSLEEWACWLHNSVNVRFGGSQWTLDQLRKAYPRDQADDETSQPLVSDDIESTRVQRRSVVNPIVSQLNKSLVQMKGYNTDRSPTGRIVQTKRINQRMAKRRQPKPNIQLKPPHLQPRTVNRRSQRYQPVKHPKRVSLPPPVQLVSDMSGDGGVKKGCGCKGKN